MNYNKLQSDLKVFIHYFP